MLASSNRASSLQPSDTNPNYSSHGRYSIVSHLGIGGFSHVYKVTDAEGSSFALKKSRITKNIRNPMLRHEVCALTLLAGHPSIPKVYAWGRSQYFEYMVMDLLGKCLEDFTKDRARCHLKNVLRLSAQMLTIVEHLHSNHIIHCDIKPSNFMFSTKGNSGRLYLIDYGLARYYRDPSNLQHYPEHKQKFTGTSEYASINVHNRLSNSRRDDLESVAYVIAYLLRGRLPWDSGFRHRMQHRRDICQYKKQIWTGDRLFEGFPKELAGFLDYVRALEYDQQPDYNRWKLAFRNLAEDATLQTPQHANKLLPPVRRGDCVLVQLIPKAMGSKHSFVPRPAVVLGIEPVQDDLMGAFRVSVSPLLHQFGNRDDSSLGLNYLGLSAGVGYEHVVLTSPASPMDDMYLFLLPRSFDVQVERDQSFVSAHWKLDETQLRHLEACLASVTPPTLHPTEATAHNAVQTIDNLPISAWISPLTPAYLRAPESREMCLEGSHGFVNDIDTINRLRSREDNWVRRGDESDTAEAEESGLCDPKDEICFSITWPEPAGVRSRSLFGDEQKLVQEYVAFMDAPPIDTKSIVDEIMTGC